MQLGLPCKEYLRNSITQLPKKSNVPADVSLRLKNIWGTHEVVWWWRKDMKKGCVNMSCADLLQTPSAFWSNQCLSLLFWDRFCDIDKVMIVHTNNLATFGSRNNMKRKKKFYEAFYISGYLLGTKYRNLLIFIKFSSILVIVNPRNQFIFTLLIS